MKGKIRSGEKPKKWRLTKTFGAGRASHCGEVISLSSIMTSIRESRERAERIVTKCDL
jgi:hypothetical protein